jgi:D-threo-aldose 1-dehydrogenase
MSALVRPATAAAALGLGGAPLGNLFTAIDDDRARATVDAAWEAGLRLFDTAPHYGLGLSERRLGAALADRPREEYLLSTKVGRLLVPHDAPRGSDLEAGGFDVPDTLTRQRDYSRDGVLRSLEESLTRLGLDRVDIVLVHDAEDHLDQALREALPALCELRDQGVVGAVGAGMNLVEPLERFAGEGADVVMVAGRWTLLDRSAAGLLDRCAERGVAVLVAGPFNSGILAQPTPPAAGTFDYAPASGDLLRRARAMADRCRELGTTLPAAALQFALRHPAVTHVVAGLRSPEEVAQAAARIGEPLPDGLWEQV